MKFNRFLVMMIGVLSLISVSAFANEDDYGDVAPPVDDYSSYPVDGEIPPPAPPQVPMDDGQQYEE